MKIRPVEHIISKLEEVSHAYGRMGVVETFSYPDVWAMKETLRWVLYLRQDLPVYPQELAAE